MNIKETKKGIETAIRDLQEELEIAVREDYTDFSFQMTHTTTVADHNGNEIEEICLMMHSRDRNYNTLPMKEYWYRSSRDWEKVIK